MFRSLIARGLALLFLLGPAAGWAVEKQVPDEPAAKLSTLGRKPDWSELEPYQGTMTHDEFVTLLNHVYGTRGFDSALIEVQPEAVRILTESGTRNYFTLRFARSESERLPLSHWWRAPRELPAPSEAKPLAGLHIALDHWRGMAISNNSTSASSCPSICSAPAELIDAPSPAFRI